MAATTQIHVKYTAYTDQVCISKTKKGKLFVVSFSLCFKGLEKSYHTKAWKTILYHRPLKLKLLNIRAQRPDVKLQSERGWKINSGTLENEVERVW